MLRKTLFATILLAFSLSSMAQTLKETLPNGLQVIVYEDNRAPVVMSQIWYRVGSVDEKVGKSGLSHALEHMMFKGTPTVPSGEFARQISEMGGINNAYTSATETVFHEKAAKEHLPKLLEMEADRMVNLNFSDRDFINEMKVIREERRQSVEDNPSGAMREALIGYAYEKPSNRTTVIGHMRDLHTLKANDLRNWYKKWYAPNNAIIVIVGDVDARETIDLVKQKFGHIPRKTLPERNDISEKMERKGNRIHESIAQNKREARMVIAYRVPTLQNIDETTPYALEMLSTILSGHSAARLPSQFVRGKQLALGIHASYMLVDRQPQLFTINVLPRENVNTTQLRQAIEKEIADIAQNGVSPEELQRAKIVQETDAIFNRDNIANQASIIGTLEINGFDFKDENIINQRLLQVSSSDIQAAAKLLTPSRQTVVAWRTAQKQKNKK